VQYHNKKESVRLIGIDTSEVRVNEKLIRDAKNDKRKQNELLQQGQLASSYVKEIVKEKDEVFLEFDKQKRDKYKRLLAYVYFKDGKMLNVLLLEKGLAKAVNYPPNNRYKKLFWNLTPL
jgi:micrococcal nuclease